jgi:hypothetical protein
MENGNWKLEKRKERGVKKKQILVWLTSGQAGAQPAAPLHDDLSRG